MTHYKTGMTIIGYGVSASGATVTADVEVAGSLYQSIVVYAASGGAMPTITGTYQEYWYDETGTKRYRVAQTFAPALTALTDGVPLPFALSLVPCSGIKVTVTFTAVATTDYFVGVCQGGLG